MFSALRDQLFFLAGSSFLLGAEPGHHEQLALGPDPNTFFRPAAAALGAPRSFRESLRQNDARPPLHLLRPARPGDGGVGAQRQSRGRTRSLSELTCSEPVSKFYHYNSTIILNWFNNFLHNFSKLCCLQFFV